MPDTDSLCIIDDKPNIIYLFPDESCALAVEIFRGVAIGVFT